MQNRWLADKAEDRLEVACTTIENPWTCGVSLRVAWWSPDPRLDTHERSEDPRFAAAASRWPGTRPVESQGAGTPAASAGGAGADSRLGAQPCLLEGAGLVRGGPSTGAGRLRRGSRRGRWRGAAGGAGADAPRQPSPLPGGDPVEPATVSACRLGLSRGQLGPAPVGGLPAAGRSRCDHDPELVLSAGLRRLAAPAAAARRLDFRHGSHGGLGRPEMLGGPRCSRRSVTGDRLFAASWRHDGAGRGGDGAEYGCAGGGGAQAGERAHGGAGADRLRPWQRPEPRASRCSANRRQAAWRPTTSPMPSRRN